MTDDHIDMPTVVQEEWIDRHETAENAREAHPIDEDILHEVCDTKLGPILVDYGLSLVQAVATQMIDRIRVRGDVISESDGKLYAVVTSPVFYEILNNGSLWYRNGDVKVEDVEDIAESHTRQFLRDLHGYDGDFGGVGASGRSFDPTISNARNDSDIEPDDGYTYVDSRGLVVDTGTHPNG